MLTTERMARIMVDISIGEDSHADTEEEKDFIKKISKEIEDSDDQELIMRIPGEWEVDL